MKILVVDDNQINLRVASAHLISLGVPANAIMTAVNGREAVELCSKEVFSLIFMDIHMPEMDGIEASRQIIQGSSVQPKIIALTANDSQEVEHEIFAAGMQMLMPKPVTKSAFIDALALARIFLPATVDIAQKV